MKIKKSSLFIFFAKGALEMVISKELEEKRLLLDLIKRSLKEMEEKQVIQLLRGDLIGENERPLYRLMYKEFKEVQSFLKEGGSVDKAKRYLSMEIFDKRESFFMDLFDTNEFPILFELFEYV